MAVTEPPFVNRTRELIELALMNAYFIHTARQPGTNVNWRSHYFVFAAQMYGAGKTRFGIEFITETKAILAMKDAEDIYKQFCPPQYVMVLPQLLSIVQEFAMNASGMKYFDVGTRTTFQEFLSSSQFPTESKLNSENFPTYILKECESAQAPLFWHFDEIGHFDIDNLCQLRNCCFEAVKYIQPNASSFPFFLFSGRGAVYNELEQMQVVGSHWLILEPLRSEHVIQILHGSTYSGSHFDFQNNLTTEQVDDVVDCLIEWTGGPPGPLVYAIHMLQSIYPTYSPLFKSRCGLKQLFNMLVDFVSRNKRLFNELGPSTGKSDGLTDDENKVYDHFLYLSWQGKTKEKSFTLPNGKDSDTYLRSFNIFAKSVSNGVRLVCPAFVSHLMWKTRFTESFKHILEYSFEETSRIFEEVVPKVLLVWQFFQKWANSPALFPHLIPQELVSGHVKLFQWENRGPIVKKGGALSQDEIKDVASSHNRVKVKKLLPPSLLGFFYDQLEIGAMVIFGPKSSSCDIVIKLQEKLVVELEMKSGVSKKTIEEELDKSVVTASPNYKYESIFICLCTGGTSSTKSLKRRNNITFFFPTIQELEKFFGPSLLSVLSS